MERKDAIHHHCDVFIAGGGPAGAAAAVLLARAGLSVILAERDSFPRFRIGESLVPMINPILKELGIWEKMEAAGFIRKYGAEFFNCRGNVRVHNIFSQGMIPDVEFTYQVERSKFDLLLLDHARESGVRVLQPARVTSASEISGGWTLTIKANEEEFLIQSRFLLDATGRDAFTGRASNESKDALPYPRRMAVFNHFTGVQRVEGIEGGNIRVIRLPSGWFWLIPIDAHRTSVGAVTMVDGRIDTPESLFNALVGESPLLLRLMAGACATDSWRVTSDYTYSYTSYAGSRLLRVGDSAGFIDPIFSSGVFLAMDSAREAAKMIATAAEEDRSLTLQEQKRYTSGIKNSVLTFRKLIDAFYDDAGFSVFMHPTNRFNLFPAVNSVVAGNTRLAFPVWWRFQLFLLICRLNRHLPLAPDVNRLRVRSGHKIA